MEKQRVVRRNGKLYIHHSLLPISALRKLSTATLEKLVHKGNLVASDVIIERLFSNYK